MLKKNLVKKNNNKNDLSSDVGYQKKSLRQLSNDPNFKPKVLVRGSDSESNSKKIQEEVVLVFNPFDVLSDEALNEEYESSVWPKLRDEVGDIFESGSYPSKEIRANWSLRQLKYFYDNCQKFHLDPICEEDKEDVNSDVDGIASDMKPKFEVGSAEILENDSADVKIVSNGI
ncbi:hypothetical protein Tco_0322188 [Tanacetum coccineum]